MSFFENINSVFETKFNVVPKPGGGSSGGAGDWNTLANRPFGYVEHYDLLAETAVTFSGSDTSALGALALNGELTEGKAYPVNFDGTQYLCRYESGKLGNLALEDGTDTGEPFLWYVTESMILTTAGAGTHTVSLQGDVPQKVPYEYLPFGYEEKILVPDCNISLEVEPDMGLLLAALPGTVFPSLTNNIKVKFNNKTYICQVKNTEDGFIYAGNAMILGYEDTGEPFVISFRDTPGDSGIIVFTDITEITFSLSEIVPVKIPVDFMNYEIPEISMDEGVLIPGEQKTLSASFDNGRFDRLLLNPSRCVCRVTIKGVFSDIDHSTGSGTLADGTVFLYMNLSAIVPDSVGYIGTLEYVGFFREYMVRLNISTTYCELSMRQLDDTYYWDQRVIT